jgi:hypothetical protein
MGVASLRGDAGIDEREGQTFVAIKDDNPAGPGSVVLFYLSSNATGRLDAVASVGAWARYGNARRDWLLSFLSRIWVDAKDII